MLPCWNNCFYCSWCCSSW